MNIGLVDSELNFNFRLFCKTVSNSANWGFDRFRLYSSKWHTKVQVRRPDGSIVATKDFASGSFEHDFSFDLSGNVNNEEYSVYIAGVAATSKFVQVYAFPTGFGGTYGRNAEITFWDFNQVNLVDDGANGIGRIRLENQPLTALAGINNIAAGEIKFINCELDAETLADALIAVDNSGVLNGSFNYSDNLAAPAERALTAYNNLKDNKGWVLTGEVPAPSVTYDPKTVEFMNTIGTPDDSNASIYSGKTNNDIWKAVDTYFRTLKSDGILSKMKAVYLFIGGTDIKHKFNALNPQDSDAAFRILWYGSGTHGVGGFKGNGSNAYGDTRFSQANNSARDNESFGIYSRSDFNGVYADIGIWGDPHTYIFSRYNNEFWVRSQKDTTHSVANSDSRGFFAANRSGGTVTSQKNSSFSSSPIASSGIDNNTFWIGARNGSSSLNSPREYAYAFLASAMTKSEMTAHYNAVQKLQTDLGRQV